MIGKCGEVTMRAAFCGAQRLLTIAALAGSAFAAARAQAADAAYPSNEDLRHVRAMADPRIAPDGRRVLVRISDSTADGGRGHIWLVDVAGSPARQLTFSPAGDKAGERQGPWLRGGKVAFFAQRGGDVGWKCFVARQAGGVGGFFPPADVGRGSACL